MQGRNYRELFDWRFCGPLQVRNCKYATIANLLVAVAVAHCTDALINCWRVISVAHCKDAATANSLIGVPVVRCKEAATGRFLIKG